MDKSAIDTPSREIDLGNIPVHLRTALRRALEFEARAPAPRSAEEAEQCEEQLRVIADEFFGALLTPVLQRAVRSAAVGDAASALVRHLPRRMRSDGLETVDVRTSRGTTVPVTTPYYREKHARRAKRRPGLYPALVVLGIYDRCTPKLASDASRAVAMLSSLAEAQAQLRSEGIALDIKTLRSTAYRYAARARAAQQSAACGLLDRVTGKRVVVSLDGGRVRVRRKKRGPKTKKGRNRFHTDWKEPKLLILYVVGDDGRPSQTWAPIIDGTLRGPQAVFALLLSYARQIGLNAADKVLFIADGAPWIWQRLQRLIAALGLSPTQVLGLIDFYHAAKQLSDAVKLRRWSATQRTRWLNRTRGLLKRARVDEVITALRELCRGRTAGKIRTHLNYFLKNRHRFAYTTMVGLGLPRGSGAVESAIGRVINLRIKGAHLRRARPAAAPGHDVSSAFSFVAHLGSRQVQIDAVGVGLGHLALVTRHLYYCAAPAPRLRIIGHWFLPHHIPGYHRQNRERQNEHKERWIAVRKWLGHTAVIKSQSICNFCRVLRLSRTTPPTCLRHWHADDELTSPSPEIHPEQTEVTMPEGQDHTGELGQLAFQYLVVLTVGNEQNAALSFGFRRRQDRNTTNSTRHHDSFGITPAHE